MTANEYQQWTASTDQSGKELWYYALGLAGESGEAVDAIKKGYRHAGVDKDKPLDKDKVVHELGDAMWYLARLADKIGYTLEDVMALNRRKLEARYGKTKQEGS